MNFLLFRLQATMPAAAFQSTDIDMTEAEPTNKVDAAQWQAASGALSELVKMFSGKSQVCFVIEW